MSGNTVRLSFALFVFYIMLTADVSRWSLLTGAAIALIAARVWSGVFFKEKKDVVIPGILVLAMYFFYLIFEIYKASLFHIARIVKNDSSPVAVRVALERPNPFIAAAVANSITLTPGTIAIDVSDCEILVLSANGRQGADKLQLDIKRSFEKRLRKR